MLTGVVRKYPEKKAWAVLFLNNKDEKFTEDFSLNSMGGLIKAACFNWNMETVVELHMWLAWRAGGQAKWELRNQMTINLW